MTRRAILLITAKIGVIMVADEEDFALSGEIIEETVVTMTDSGDAILMKVGAIMVDGAALDSSVVITEESGAMMTDLDGETTAETALSAEIMSTVGAILTDGKARALNGVISARADALSGGVILTATIGAISRCISGAGANAGVAARTASEKALLMSIEIWRGGFFYRETPSFHR